MGNNEKLSNAINGATARERHVFERENDSNGGQGVRLSNFAHK